MAAKKEVYINAELDWAEDKLFEWRKYIDDNPIDKLKDRINFKETKSGGTIPMVVASIESQIKSLRDTMKEYLTLLDQVGKMREVQAMKEKEVRGGGDVPYRMRNGG